MRFWNGLQKSIRIRIWHWCFTQTCQNLNYIIQLFWHVRVKHHCHIWINIYVTCLNYLKQTLGPFRKQVIYFTLHAIDWFLYDWRLGSRQIWFIEVIFTGKRGLEIPWKCTKKLAMWNFGKLKILFAPKLSWRMTSETFFLTNLFDMLHLPWHLHYLRKKD